MLHGTDSLERYLTSQWLNCFLFFFAFFFFEEEEEEEDALGQNRVLTLKFRAITLTSSFARLRKAHIYQIHCERTGDGTFSTAEEIGLGVAAQQQ